MEEAEKSEKKEEAEEKSEKSEKEPAAEDAEITVSPREEETRVESAVEEVTKLTEVE